MRPAMLWIGGGWSSWMQQEPTPRWLDGRAFRSPRLIAQVPHGHWKTNKFVVGLRFDGFVAPLVVDGPMHGDVFLADVQQHLV